MDVRVDYKEGWAQKWCFWTVVLEKTLESPLDCKEIQPVHPKGNESWVFIGRTDVKAETPILWPPDVKSWLIWKDPDVQKDWRQEKGTTEDEMVGRHHWLDGRESEWTLGVGDGQGGLVCCSPWGHRESDTTKGLKWTELKFLRGGISRLKHIQNVDGYCRTVVHRTQFTHNNNNAKDCLSPNTVPSGSLQLLGTGSRSYLKEFLFCFPLIISDVSLSFLHLKIMRISRWPTDKWKDAQHY